MVIEFIENFPHNLFKPLLLFFYLGFLIPILTMGVAAVIAAGATAAPATADPDIDKYGREICQALHDNPSHREVLKAIATVRDYAGLSDEDAEIVVLQSLSRSCPQYLRLVAPADPQKQ